MYQEWRKFKYLKCRCKETKLQDFTHFAIQIKLREIWGWGGESMKIVFSDVSKCCLCVKLLPFRRNLLPPPLEQFSCVLRMGITGSSETFITLHRTSRRHILEYCGNVQNKPRWNSWPFQSQSNIQIIMPPLSVLLMYVSRLVMEEPRVRLTRSRNAHVPHPEAHTHP
jgi:hypothetical protein